MKMMIVLCLLMMTLSVSAVTFEKIDSTQLDSGTLKDFYPLIERLQSSSPLLNKYKLFLRAAQIYNLDSDAEVDVIAEFVAWPFNWTLDASSVDVIKAPRKDNMFVLEQALLKNAFFVKKEFKNDLKNFAYLLEMKMSRNGRIRLYEVAFSEELEATGFAIINSKSEEALLVLAIED